MILTTKKMCRFANTPVASRPICFSVYEERVCGREILKPNAVRSISAFLKEFFQKHRKFPQPRIFIYIQGQIKYK